VVGLAVESSRPDLTSSNANQELTFVYERFKKFLQKYNKPEPSKDKLPGILKIFHANEKVVDKLGRLRQSIFDASFDSTTKFADLDFDTFRDSSTGLIRFLKDELDNVKDRQAIRKCQKLNWATMGKNVLPPIRDQGSCGSCYAVTTADLITAQNAIEGLI